MDKNSSLNPKTIKKYFKDQKPPDINQLKAANPNYKFTDNYFPPNSDSLYSIMNGKFVDEINGKENKADLIKEYEVCDEEGDKSNNANILVDKKKKSVENIEWKRATEIIEIWEMFQEKIEFADVEQGNLGDCYFCSALAALAAYPYLVREKFRIDEFNEEGYYEVILFIDGEWQIVFLDDYFPYDIETKKWAFARPNKNELWAILLEKAWAKVNGGYSNIIGGIVRDPISALTGFPTEDISHKEDEGVIFFKILHADESKSIMSSQSKEKIKEVKGISEGHAYTLITAKKYKNDATNLHIYLVKLRNPWGIYEWTGDWSDNSDKWTKELKKHFGWEKKEDGIFWIDIKNYKANFDYTFICHLLFGASFKNFYIDYEDYFKEPLIFNLKINEKSLTGITLYFKEWRYNRDLQDVKHPAYLFLCKYDENKNLSNFYSQSVSEKDLNFVENLEPGNYVLWIYTPHDCIKNDNNFKYTLTIYSSSFVVEYIGLDHDYSLIKQLILEKNRQGVSFNNSKKFCLIEDNELGEKGFDTILIYNKSKKSHSFDLVLFKHNKNVKYLPPYDIFNKSSKIIVPANESRIVLALNLNPEFKQKSEIYQEKHKKEEHKFGFSLDISKKKKQSKALEDPVTDSVSERNVFDEYLKLDIKENEENEGPRTNSYTFITKDQLENIPVFDVEKVINENLLSRSSRLRNEEDKLKEDYPFEMNFLLNNFEPIEESIDKNWNSVDLIEYIYVGELDSIGNLEGRGILIFKSNLSKYIGYFKESNFEIGGFLLNEENKKIYEGGYCKGKRNGKGKFYIIPDEEYCEGYFNEDTLEGNGKYYFKNGDIWEGPFKNTMKDGPGIMTYKNNPDKIFIVEYADDHCIRKIDLEEEQQNELKNLISKKETEQNKDDLDLKMNFIQEYLEKKINFEKKDNWITETDENITESEEEIKEREYFKQLAEIKEQAEPFMFEQFSEFANPLGFDEKLAFLTYKRGQIYMGGVDENKLPHGRGGYFDNINYIFGYFEHGKVSQTRKCICFTHKKLLWRIGILDQNFNFKNYGIEYYNNGDKYIGYFAMKDDSSESVYQGFGNYFFTNGDSWSGNFDDNKKNGKGIYYSSKGLFYREAEYKNDKIISKGPRKKTEFMLEGSEEFFKTTSEKYPELIKNLHLFFPYRENESESELVWINKTLDDGTIYIGQATKNENNLQGKGCFIYEMKAETQDIDEILKFEKYKMGYVSNGYLYRTGKSFNKDWKLVYQGDFKNNKKEKFGVLYYPNETYYGQFYNDLQHGVGVTIFKNGSRYEGLFENGERDGKGYLIDSKYTFMQEVTYDHGNVISQGEKIKCRSLNYKNKLREIYTKNNFYNNSDVKLFKKLPPTEDNLVLKIGVQYCKDGIYTGEFNSCGFRHGRGVLRKPLSTEYYCGYFVNNYKQGKGTHSVSQDESYEGNFEFDFPCGEGKYKKNGENFEGTFNEIGEGEGIFYFNDASTWKGPFYAWKMDGIGDYTLKGKTTKAKYEIGNYVE